jgi:hypothetical protein
MLTLFMLFKATQTVRRWLAELGTVKMDRARLLEFARDDARDWHNH